jgi:23S rRNA (uridine2552-2'-O)-methyltransferase
MNIFSKFTKKNKSNRSWINNHQNDFYVKKAKENQFRSRAAYKLIEINNKYKIFKHHEKVLDIGCAPGGWCQVVLKNNNKVWGVDILPMKPIDNVNFYQIDISLNEGKDLVDYYNNLLGNRFFDVVISDAACNTTGQTENDHFRTTAINLLVINNLKFLLKNYGHWVFKTFNGIDTPSIIKLLKQQFKKVTTFKPLSSKPESKELYIICLNYLL